MVNGNKVHFGWYQAGNLWYRVEFKDPDSDENMFYEFPVPVEDVGEAVFHAEDKAILFMRYIRKHMALEEEANKANKAKEV